MALSRFPHQIVFALLLPLAATACGDDDALAPNEGGGSGVGAGGGGGSGGIGDEGGGAVEPLSFAPCDWFTINVPDTIPAVDDGACATTSVPLVRDDLASEDIDIFVKRLPALEPVAGQLWLLDGGPGGEGVVMEIYAARFREMLPDHDIFVPHHRGVGESTRLTCTGEDPGSPNGVALTEEEYIACGQELALQYGERLAGFSPSESASDLAELIERSLLSYKSPVPVTVYGGSYGTYLALRLAALHPEAYDRLILDSTCAPGYCWSAERDALYDATAQRILARCVAEDPTCADRLGPAPWTTVASAFANLDSGACPGLSQVGIGRDVLKVLLGQLVQSTQARAAMGPVIARVNRCEPDDVDAVIHLVNYVFNGPPSPLSGHFGQALYANIIASELYALGTPDTAAIAAEAAQLYAARGTTLFTSMLYENWPRYQPDEALSATIPNIDKPVLMLSGGMDPLTPPDTIAAFEVAFGGPNYHHVVFEDLGHGLVSLSTDPDNPDSPSCGSQLVAQFTANASVPADIDCIADTPALAFDASVDEAQTYFGRDDLWD